MTRREFAAGMLTAPQAGTTPPSSGTAILPVGGPWLQSNRAVDLQTSGDFEELLGPAAAPVARERWRIASGAGRFSWHIRREFLREVRVEEDRFPALLFPSRSGRGFGEIPGFLDNGMILNRSSAFPLRAGDPEWYEAISASRNQKIHFAPSGKLLESRFESGFFTYAKTCADGTAGAVLIGAETLDRRSGPVLRRAGEVQEQTWTLTDVPNHGAAPFSLQVPDDFIGQQAHSLATVHNQWMGWLFGNNPASVPILHEMAWYPMIASIYAHDEQYRNAVERQLLFFADTGVEPSGYPFPRWWMKGYYRVVWGNLMDQVPHFILAMYYHALNTGSREFVRRVMPALDRVARYLLSLDADGDGVVEVPGTSGLPDGKHDCSNWFDIIKFGHKDAYVNVYSVAALGAMAEIKDFAGQDARPFRQAHARFVQGFNKTFWDEHAGYYMDWIDTRGRGRRYFYTDPNLLAVIFGIAGPSRARRILANLDARYGALCRKFRVSRDAIWATPANMHPVTDPGDLVDFGKLGNQQVYPNYENGCSFFHTTGLEIAARGAAGQPAEAYETFARLLRHGYAKNRLWAAALKWDTGELISEPLNNALLILWGFHYGCLGLRPSFSGLKTIRSASPQLEGARAKLCSLGKDLNLAVKQGETVIEK